MWPLSQVSQKPNIFIFCSNIMLDTREDLPIMLHTFSKPKLIPFSFTWDDEADIIIGLDLGSLKGNELR
jgi:hypothetical protein